MKKDVEERFEEMHKEHVEHIEELHKEHVEHLEEKAHQIEERAYAHLEQFEEKHKEQLESIGWEIGEEKNSGRSIIEGFKESFSLHKDSADYHVIHERIVDSATVKGSNMCILILAILIASIGLNMNSTAVIIGAMLISPLMGSILAMAYGTAAIDAKLFARSLVGFLVQVLISFVISTLYFLLSPLNEVTSELFARTTPTIWDVLIAIFGGLAGIIGITRKEKSNVIPGVAIATALMPPLCTCGYSLANGQWRMLLGAGYLFFVNSYFIFLSSAIVLAVLEIPKVGNVPEKAWKKIRARVIRNTVIVIIPSIIMAIFIVRG